MSRTSNTGLCVICQVRRPHFIQRKNMMNWNKCKTFEILIFNDVQHNIRISWYKKDSNFFVKLYCITRFANRNFYCIVEHFCECTIFWSYCHSWKKTLVCGLSMILLVCRLQTMISLVLCLEFKICSYITFHCATILKWNGIESGLHSIEQLSKYLLFGNNFILSLFP